MKARGNYCFVLILFILVEISVGQYCATTYGYVRSTGTWPSDAYGEAEWDPAEDHGLMALYNSTCYYMSDPISNLHANTQYEWKVTTQNSWATNWGCGSDGVSAVLNGNNCVFTTTSTNPVRFVFDPNGQKLFVTQSGSPTQPPPTQAPTQPPTHAPTQAATQPPTQAPTHAPTQPPPTQPPPTQAPGSNVKQVFAHFMIGNTYGYTQTNFQNDMTLAKSVGIDAFALNIGNDDWTMNRVQLAYQAAAACGFKVFLSIDLSIGSYTASIIISRIQTVYSYSASYFYNGKLFVSTFGGAGVTLGYASDIALWNAIKSSLGFPIFFVPNFEVDASQIFNEYTNIDGALSWGAWPDPTSYASELTPGDEVYMNSASKAGKVYLAPVSPWFFTYLSYKSYLYHAESLWYDRWIQLIQDIKPQMIEIITWNDWGESSYIGPIDPDSGDLPDNSPNYVYGFPHTNFVNTLTYFISYYKNGVAPTVTTEVVVFWYRPFLKNSEPSNPPYSKPYVANANTSPSSYSPESVLGDNVFVLSILNQPGTMTVNSGGTYTTQNVPAGANLFTVNLNPGQQTVTLSRNSVNLCSKTGNMTVGTNPVQYNYNAYVDGCQH